MLSLTTPLNIVPEVLPGIVRLDKEMKCALVVEKERNGLYSQATRWSVEKSQSSSIHTACNWKVSLAGGQHKKVCCFSECQ